MSVQRFIRWFLPREEHFFDYLERLTAEAHNAANAMLTFGDDGMTAEALAQKVQEYEHAGDKAVHELEEALGRTFVTPLDREDLQRLGIDLDSILDLMNAAARACALLGVDRPTPPMDAMFDTLEKATDKLKDAVLCVRQHDYQKLMDDARAIRTIEKTGDRVYRTALSELFKRDDTDFRRLLREKEVLGHLEEALDHCERVAHTLMNLAVKHG